VRLEFRTTKLEKQCASERSRKKAFGDERGRRLGRRLSALLAASTLEDLRSAPGRLHELKGDRAGQYSIDLDGPYRLILEAVGDDETSAPGNTAWSQITTVRIHSIEDTHE